MEEEEDSRVEEEEDSRVEEEVDSPAEEDHFLHQEIRTQETD